MSPNLHAHTNKYTEDATACPVHTSSTDPPTIFTTVTVTSTTASNLKFLPLSVISILLAVIVVLGVVLVIIWRKRKHSITNSNGIAMTQLKYYRKHLFLYSHIPQTV